jgi:nucleoside-diphosphate-sugar epimerase
MPTILVTGADGFTGRHLVATLRQHGYAAYALLHRTPSPTDPLFGKSDDCSFTGDLFDREGLYAMLRRVRPDHVVHLAAIAFVAHGDVEAMYRTNIVGTRNLLEALSKVDVQPSTVLLASSANVYGNATVDSIDESVTPAPANDYAVSKLAMEYMAKTWTDSLPIVTVRPFNYTGVGQSESFLVPKIVAHFRRRATHIELGNIDVERDISDVRFVVDCYRRIIEGRCVGSTLNVCSGQAYSLRSIIELATEITGHRLEVRVNSQFVRANEVRSLVGSRRALEAAIGPIADRSLRDTLEWMLA